MSEITTQAESSRATALVPEAAAQAQVVKDEAKGCCIVGGGPAGAMLALLLAQRGVPVTLLEMHQDFDRELRRSG